MIKLAYYDRVPNLGDSLNRDIVGYMGVEYQVTGFGSSNLVAIGSILHNIIDDKKREKYSYHEYIDIWGSGFIKDNEEARPEYFIKKVNIHALRGRLSKQRCEKILGQDLGNVALGDPGLLASQAIPVEGAEKKYDVGIIPHYVDKDSGFLNNIRLKNKSFRIIEVLDDVRKVCREICECKVILSSAMHGLVVADSYGIPNKWIRLSDNVIGGDFKYLDYYSAFGIENVEAVDLRKRDITDDDIDLFESGYLIKKTDVEEICADLQDAFPRKRIFNLPLKLIQNIRFAMSVAEVNKNILVPFENKPVFDHLHKYFDFCISFCEKSTNAPPFENISFDHNKPFIQFGDVKKPLVFPLQIVNYCASNWHNKDRIAFIGKRTNERAVALQRWLDHSTNSGIVITDGEDVYTDGNILIIFSDMGRALPEKAWDDEYYRDLLSSRFVLCPNGDFIWTYRFFEAIICGAIPIIEEPCDLYSDFYYYDMNTHVDKLSYSRDIAMNNLMLLKEKFCFNESEIARGAFTEKSPAAKTLQDDLKAAKAKAIKENKEALECFELSIKNFRDGDFKKAEEYITRYRAEINYDFFPRKDRRSPQTPELSVIVVSYGTGPDLIVCVESLLNNNSGNYEVIVVDNGGNDDVIEKLSTLDILHVHCPRNLYPSEGRNMGAHFARGGILAFLDDDAVVKDNYVQNILKAFGEHAIAGLRGKILPKSDSSANLMVSHYDLGDEEKYIRYVNTEGCSAFQKDKYANLQGMNPLLFGYEGAELCLRIERSEGFNSFLYAPDVVICHDFANSHDKLEAKTARHREMSGYLKILHPGIFDFFIETPSGADEKISLKEQLREKNDELSSINNSRFWKLRNFIAPFLGKDKI
ncbi:MAG: glycosyltransferase [Thermoleophilia bacterium]|nr:glycosyltransferase [Thermoleophilia bacterium]